MEPKSLQMIRGWNLSPLFCELGMEYFFSNEDLYFFIESDLSNEIWLVRDSKLRSQTLYLFLKLNFFRFLDRYAKFQSTKKEIESKEGSLGEFALGYKRFGFNRVGKSIVYREWAPGAQELYVIGEFSMYLILLFFFTRPQNEECE
jgi:hypothetical protein